MAAGGRRRRSIYGTRNRSQEGGERTPPARGLLPLSLLLVLLLPGAPFASFLSSASPAAEEGKGERERWRNARCRMGELIKKLITRVGGGAAGCSEEEDGERGWMRCRRAGRNQTSFPLFLSGARDPNGLSRYGIPLCLPSSLPRGPSLFLASLLPRIVSLL
jgi:hypothetical protein